MVDHDGFTLISMGVRGCTCRVVGSPQDAFVGT